MTELRNYRRIPFHTTATIVWAQEQVPCELIDLALRGALLQTHHEVPIEIGARARVDIDLANSEVKLTFGVELIHREQNQYGFLFIDADDESLAHLRRLLELNLGDGEQVDREFVHWLQHPDH
ncbi:PilZ domain-containing protein [Pelovirga terrestris]|uniref:PilZ domain-containing protein n=1 Tax=Pelovirga terrestris TaxID=2771352 RepID=A0A8J6ULI3_9BACT|nr:PilZ domain-containing protein [Pelovirga terrestris]MBD1401207.1 PilZ domain-containing protein [Pelovirga terrestris]